MTHLQSDSLIADVMIMTHLAAVISLNYVVYSNNQRSEASLTYGPPSLCPHLSVAGTTATLLGNDTTGGLSYQINMPLNKSGRSTLQ